MKPKTVIELANEYYAPYLYDYGDCEHQCIGAFVAGHASRDVEVKDLEASAYLYSIELMVLEAKYASSIENAVARLLTALKYGPDMRSSAELCIQDAIALLIKIKGE